MAGHPDRASAKDGAVIKELRVDGGMVMNNWFSQFLSDILNIKIYRSKIDETTALGAAFMAGLQIGVFKSLNDISKKWKLNRKFVPKIKSSNRINLLKGWSLAIKRTLIQ